MTVMMSKDEYRGALAILDLKQEEVGHLLGVGQRTARRWASGEIAVPGPIEMHIRVWLERPELLEVVRRIARERDGSEEHL
ncbi:MAG TPA: hypothetical protein PK264_18900 [Hyphomicrobiaceae bacterium]|nr:hypothetical protein [Hyphomicrobiaceae bacterium]